MKKNNNGTSAEINLVENVDYFNMADGLYLTIESICKKYGIGKSTVYHKASENNLTVRKIAGVACYLDHKGFQRQPRVYDTKHLKPATPYVELVHMVRENVEDTKKKWADNSIILSKYLNRLDDINTRISALGKSINDVFITKDDTTEELKMIRQTLQEILEKLNK